MFERLRSFIKGVGQLIRNPTLLEEYQSALSTVDHYQKEAIQDNQRLQEAYGQASAKLKFHKEMESEGIAVGQAYVDTELGPELLLVHPEKVHAQKGDVSVSYLEVTGFTVKDGGKWIETNLGDVRVERFLARKDQGKLVTIEQAARDVDQANRQKQSVIQGQDAQVASVQNVPGYAALTGQMKEAGYIPTNTPGFSDDFLMWKDVRTGKEIGIDGWEGVKYFLADLSQGKSCGMLIYPGGETQHYSNPDQFLKAYRESLDYLGPNGVSAKTLTNDPSVRKAVDDLIYGEFGEENPHDLDYYTQRQGAPEPAPQQEAAGMEM